MSILRRLKQAEKVVAGSESSEAAQVDLMEWLQANTYKEGQGESFHEWSDRMPKRLVRPFVDYIKKNMNMGGLNLSRDWIGE